MTDIPFQAKLAEAVENHPCLYDFYLKEYSNRDEVQRAWQSVAEELDSSVKKCKETWRSMRVVFARNIKLPPTGPKAKKKPWPLLQNLMFLKPYMATKGSDQPSNLPYVPSMVDNSLAANNTPGELVEAVLHLKEEPVEEGEETNKRNEAGSSCTIEPWAIKPLLPFQKKTDAVELDYIKSEKCVTCENPRKQFLLSLSTDVEEMTAPQFKKFRREVLDLIDQIVEPHSSVKQYEIVMQPSSLTNA